MAEQDLPFSRDLGYLDKFLASLDAHADTLAEPARSELKRMVALERGQWGRLKVLLAGQPMAPLEVAEDGRGRGVQPVPQAPRGLTVGSLIKRP